MSLVEFVKVEPLTRVENNEEVEFVWGKKRGFGGKGKKIPFFESFTYNGMEYALYDCVYMLKEGESPYIGKVIKIWENPDKSRKVKVHWFFRPSEISYYLKDVKVAENEIFLASGEGAGLSNVNPLEAVAGKCNVVCISDDERNPQPSKEEVKMADYVFYRAFDVGKCAILDKMDDKIGGLDVKFIFNRKESQNANDVLTIASDQKEDKNVVLLKPHNHLATAKPSHLSGKSDVDAVVRQDKLQKDTNVVRFKQSATGEQNSHDDSRVAKTAGESSNLVGKSDADVPSSRKQDALREDANDSRLEQQSTMKGTPAPVQIVNSKTATTVGDKQNTSSKENAHCKRKSEKDDKKVSTPPNNVVKADERQKSPEDADRKIATTVGDKQNTSSKENAHCKIKNEKDDKKVSKPPENMVKADERQKSPKDAGALDDRPLKRLKVNGSVTRSEDKAVNNVQNTSVCRNDKKIPGTSALSYEQAKKSGDVKLSGELGKSTKIRKDSAALDNRPLKKGNVDTLKVKEDVDKSNISTVKRDDNLGNLPKSSTSSKDIERMQGKSFGTSPKGVEIMHGKSFEVTRRPITESSKWFKAPPWDEVMQTANEQGTLVLLENLNPDYTSGEVEDIIWHACRENCTAKMVQRTACCSPYCGRALVAFKTREAAERVTKKLDDGCLMLSNQRPLVGSFLSLPKTEGNSPSFAGHLCVDKLKLQLQREMKAVSTSHCSQPNTIEYEMALEWSLLQSRSNSWGSRLYKQQKEDIRKITSELKKK